MSSIIFVMKQGLKTLLISISIIVLVIIMTFYVTDYTGSDPDYPPIDPLSHNQASKNFTVDLKNGEIIVQAVPFHRKSGWNYQTLIDMKHETSKNWGRATALPQNIYNELQKSCPNKLNLTVRQAYRSLMNYSLCGYKIKNTERSNFDEEINNYSELIKCQNAGLGIYSTEYKNSNLTVTVANMGSIEFEKVMVQIISNGRLLKGRYLDFKEGKLESISFSNVNNITQVRAISPNCPYTLAGMK